MTPAAGSASPGSPDGAIGPGAVVRYEDDCYGWAIQQIDLLRAGRRDAIDLPHLAEALAGMAAQERAKLKAALEQVLQCLLKWDHRPEARNRSWTLTIHQQRRRINRQMRKQPGLVVEVPEAMREAYAPARATVTGDLGLDEDALPQACPYLWDDILGRTLEWGAGE